jgi:tetratricopeptide (TPR) repeat protein
MVVVTAVLAVIITALTSCSFVGAGDLQYHEQFWTRYRLAGDRARLEEDYPTAVKMYRLALNEAERFGDGDIRLSATLNDLADAYAADKDWPAALSIFKQAEANLRRLWQGGAGGAREQAAGLELSRSMAGTGDALFKQGQSAQAEKCYETALEIEQKLMGTESERANKILLGAELCKTLLGMAAIETNKGEYQKAEPLYRAALKASHELQGGVGMEALARKDYAQMLRLSGRDAEANSGEQAPVAEFRSNAKPSPECRGDKPDEEFKMVMNEGISLEAARNFERARAKFQEARKFTKNPNTLAINRCAIGRTYYEQGKLKEAQAILEAAVKEHENLMGPEDFFTAIALAHLANCYTAQGNYAGAERAWKRVITVYEDKMPQTGPQLTEALTAYLQVLRMERKVKEAEAVEQRLKQNRY